MWKHLLVLHPPGRGLLPPPPPPPRLSRPHDYDLPGDGRITRPLVHTSRAPLGIFWSMTSLNRSIRAGHRGPPDAHMTCSPSIFGNRAIAEAWRLTKKQHNSGRNKQAARMK